MVGGLNPSKIQESFEVHAIPISSGTIAGSFPETSWKYQRQPPGQFIIGSQTDSRPFNWWHLIAVPCINHHLQNNSGRKSFKFAYQIDCLVATQALWVVIFQDQISQKHPLYPQVISHMENGSFISGDVPWLSVKLPECIFQNHRNLRGPHMEISSPESSKSWTTMA